MKNMGFNIDWVHIKWIIYFLILAYASYQDLRTKTIADKVHIFLLILGIFEDCSINSIIAAIIIPIPFLITALAKDNGIGGGDVKFMAANGFVLGIKKGIIGSIVGLLIAIIINVIYYKFKNKDKKISFALAPYLSIGCLFAYTIKLGGIFR
ncbi:UNVERIFIED_CONTAM: leader peptidase (prepilin peptidase)/N-methyltransferase [Acetivibrio alkalicellulosi]